MNAWFPLRTGYAVYISVSYLIFSKTYLCDLRYKTNRYLIRRFATELSAMKVLNVAEKNDVAKNVAFFLSGGNVRTVSIECERILFSFVCSSRNILYKLCLSPFFVTKILL